MATSENPEFQLTFLCSLIPRSFDGKRSEFHEFITNCNNAVELASESQQKPLFVYIISKLTGSVRSQLQGKTYKSWVELKEILCTFYQDKKHYIQLMEELNTLKQGMSESVGSFHERIDKLTTRLLSSISFKNENEHIGKIETIKELALSRFLHHSKPEISRFLRSQQINEISDALCKAIEEERAINICSNEFKSKLSIKYCNFCKRNGHNSKDCFKKPNNNTTINFNQKSNHNHSHKNPNGPSNFPNTDKFCNYCKNRGHLINECRKREYNNKRKAQQNSRQSPNSNPNSSNQVHLNSLTSQVDVALAEN